MTIRKGRLIIAGNGAAQVATTERAGLVQPDGTTIQINDQGIITANIPEVEIPEVDTSSLATKQELSDGLEQKQDKGDYALKSDIPSAYELPIASTDILGGVKVDGETITIADGIISAIISNASGASGDWEYQGSGDDWYLKHTQTGLIIQCLSWSGNLTGKKTTSQLLMGGTITSYVATTTKTFLIPFTKHVVFTQPFGQTKVYPYTANNITTDEYAHASASNLTTVQISISCSNSAAANSRAYDVKFMAIGY